MPVPPAATRRTALGGALAAAVLTACDLHELDPRSDPGAAPTQSTPPVDADILLVQEALAAITAASGLVSEADRYPSLRGPLRPLKRMHAAHVDVFKEYAGEDPQTVSTTGSAAAFLRRVRRQEAQLQRQLVEWAIKAESGQLAKLLASMSAGVAQHLAALDDLVLEVPR